MQRKYLPAALMIAAFAGLPAAAFAQATSPAPATMAPAAPAMAPTATPAATPAAAAPMLPKAEEAKLDAHIKTLHNQLKITPAEESDWAQFATVMRTNAYDMNQAFQARAHVGSMTAPANMQSYAGLAEVHADGMQKLSAAFQTLYNTFPDDQKKIADEVFQDKMSKHKAKP